MDQRISYWITLIATIAACFFFGLSFTSTAILWASGITEEYPGALGYEILWVPGILYFGIILFLGWLPMHNKREGQKTVQIIVVILQCFTMLGAFGGGLSDEQQKMTILIPLLCIGIIVGAFWFMRYLERQRLLENPEN